MPTTVERDAEFGFGLWVRPDNPYGVIPKVEFVPERIRASPLASVMDGLEADESHVNSE